MPVIISAIYSKQPPLLSSKLLFSMQALYLINTFILGTCNYEASISSPLSPLIEMDFSPNSSYGGRSLI